MFCSLVHVLVKAKAMPSMVGKLIVKIEALSFQVFIKYFKFIKFVVFIFFLTDVFFDFQFCEYRILDLMEVEHIILKQSLSINIIIYMKHTKVQYSHSFSDTLWSEDDSFHIWERWKINIVIIKCIPPGTYPFPEFIHIFTHEKEMTDIICLITVWTYRGVFFIFISNNFLLQFMILLINLYWNDCNFVSRKQM